MNGVDFIGASSGICGINNGEADGPLVLHSSGLIEELLTYNISATWADVNLVFTHSDKRSYLKELSTRVRDLTTRSLSLQRIPIVIGGDHTVVLGNIAASSNRFNDNLGLIWMDAHADFNTPATSETGNIHGMVLAIVAGQGYQELVNLSDRFPMIDPDNIVIFGPRTVDNEEWDNIDKTHTTLLLHDHIRFNGLTDTLDSIESKFSKRSISNIHLSIDLDVLDCSYYPGVSTPVQFGLCLDDVTHSIQRIKKRFNIVSADIVEFNPRKDKKNATLYAAMEIAKTIVR